MKVPTVCIDRIKELAKQEGLTLKFFSDRFGKKQSYFGDIRNGKNRLDDSELAFIADRLHTTTDYLTGATDDPSQPAQPTDPNAENHLSSLLLFSSTECYWLSHLIPRTEKKAAAPDGTTAFYVNLCWTCALQEGFLCAFTLCFRQMRDDCFAISLGQLFQLGKQCPSHVAALCLHSPAPSNRYPSLWWFLIFD